MFGICFLALAFGNAVTAADLSFNTYMDISFYLLTANIIVYKKNPWWIVLITFLAAFNRETGMLIPALYFISQTDFAKFSFAKIQYQANWISAKKCMDHYHYFLHHFHQHFYSITSTLWLSAATGLESTSWFANAEIKPV